MSDVLTSVKTLLDANWNSSNTGGRTPAVQNIYDVKRVDVGGKDSILLIEQNELPSDNASGGTSKQKTSIVKLDIRTVENRDQAVLMKEEVERILDNAQIDVFGDQVYDLSDITNIKDLSDRTSGLFRFVVDWTLQQLNVAV